MKLDALSAEDRRDYEARLARLGLDTSAIQADVLETGAGQSMRLNMVGDSQFKPLIFQTKDLRELRKWIGTPERVANRREQSPMNRILKSEAIDKALLAGRTSVVQSALRSRKTKTAKGSAEISRAGLASMSGIKAEHLAAKVLRCKECAARGETTEKLNADELNTLRAAARTFIHGDAALVEEYRPAVEAFFDVFQVAVWLPLRIVVKKNSTLTLGPGVHNLTAYEMVVEEGGRVVSYGHLNVSVTKLRKSTGLIIKLPDHVLTTGININPFQ